MEEYVRIKTSLTSCLRASSFPASSMLAMRSRINARAATGLELFVSAKRTPLKYPASGRSTPTFSSMKDHEVSWQSQYDNSNKMNLAIYYWTKDNE